MSENKFRTKVIEVKNLSSSLYLLKLEKGEINFKPGQHITLTIPGEDKSRLYSVASGSNDPTLDVLVREITNGDLSVRFRQMEKGDSLLVTQPVGYFTIPDNYQSEKITCICTGSGIAPYRSFVRSFPNVPFKIIHGIQDTNDALDQELGPNIEYIKCTSRSKSGDYNGRVTNYIKEIKKLDTNGYYYLCGNGEMIHELYNYLKSVGVNRSNIFYEEYFNN